VQRVFPGASNSSCELLIGALPEALPLVINWRVTHLFAPALAAGLFAMTPVLKKFVQTWLINTFAVLVTVTVLPHFKCEPKWAVFLVSLLLGILNTFLRPLMMLVALPLVLYTLGLFLVVINGCLIYMVDGIMGTTFEVDGFGWAMLGSVLIGVISLILNVITGNSNAQLKVRRQQRPPNAQGRDDGGDGPVIDV
jgi:putative membrane protein